MSMYRHPTANATGWRALISPGNTQWLSFQYSGGSGPAIEAIPPKYGTLTGGGARLTQAPRWWWITNEKKWLLIVLISWQFCRAVG